ncbi:MAG: hypothetical protein JNM39_06960 [Bdellovibrionaceae bacterium]|nr:hypothetical protein [Pseudobdellovibrionaceae bacterium]
MNKMLVLLLVLALSAQALAAGTADGRHTTATPGPGTKQSADNAKKDNAKGGQVAQMISMGFMVAGTAASAACAAQQHSMCPVAPVLFGLSMLAGMQSQSNKKTAGQAYGAGIDTTGNGNYGYGDFGYDPYGNGGRDSNGNPLSERDKEALTKFNNSLAALTSDQGLHGFKFNKKNGVITTPDGKKYKVSDFESEAAMKAAGFSDSMIKGALDKSKKLEAEALDKVGGLSSVAATGFQEGGGGAPGSLAGSSGDNSEVDGGVGGSGKGRGLAGQLPGGAQGVAGLSKNFNGDPIGVAQDGLFLMMARRYKVKEKQDSFFSDADLIQK